MELSTRTNDPTTARSTDDNASRFADPGVGGAGATSSSFSSRGFSSATIHRGDDVASSRSHRTTRSGRPRSLTTRPHAFGGAVLTPKHARELTPCLVLSVTARLADASCSLHAQTSIGDVDGGVGGAPFRRSGSSDLEDRDRSLAAVASSVQYTVWITEAWGVLKWAEPSAALFWEMATMYHTLHMASRTCCVHGEDDDDRGGDGSAIPPILSCGSTSSAGSSNIGGTSSLTTNNNTHVGGAATAGGRRNAGAAAKELPVWLLGTFLLLHCEDQAYARNVSGQDERRFDADRGGLRPYDDRRTAGTVDFSTLLRHPSLSARTRIHAGQRATDHAHCAAYLARHLRKFLLLTALPHNARALHAVGDLVEHGVDGGRVGGDNGGTGNASGQRLAMYHDREHGTVGEDVSLSPSDIDRMSFVLQAPRGGGMDDPPLRVRDFFPTAQRGETVPLHLVEAVIRRFLEADLSSGADGKTGGSNVERNMAKLSLHDHDHDDDAMSSPTSPHRKKIESSSDSSASTSQQEDMFGDQKEFCLQNLRQKTIILKPQSTADYSGGKHNHSHHHQHNNSRLHDLTIDGCDDVHLYLLQPFENASVSACTGCHIVIGAVAGLLQIVDCEHTTITVATRRVLVCNCLHVVSHVFTPSPPLLLGDNRQVQFAPHNTYYDGLRDDLLATGLAARTSSSSAAANATTTDQHQLRCASNRWRSPVELAKLEIPQAARPTTESLSSPTSGTDNAPGSPKQQASSNGNDESMPTPILLPASEFQIVFVPLESEGSSGGRLRSNTVTTAHGTEGEPQREESRYCKHLSDVLRLSPFKLPNEYFKRVLVKAERMRSVQQAMRTDLLTREQREAVEEELNERFREWLVTSGNLRQVLDLVHMETNAAATSSETTTATSATRA